MSDWKKKTLTTFAGEYCCQIDQNMTWESDGARLAGLLGYDAVEWECPSGLMDMVEEDVRPYLRQELTEQLAAGDDVELVLPVINKAGDMVWLFNRGRRVTGPDGAESLVGVLVDVTRSKNHYDAEKQNTRLLEEQAKRDSLTKLYNTQTTRQLSEAYLAESSPEAGCALLIVDLDNFKMINDEFGHMFGDVVLVEVAQTIQKLFRAKDVVGRIGGEEFLVLMKDVAEREIVEERCHQLNEVFHEIQKQQLQERPLSCSIGVAFAPSHEKTYFELFRSADQALYLAKDLGKDQYIFYEPDRVKERTGKYAKQFADFK